MTAAPGQSPAPEQPRTAAEAARDSIFALVLEGAQFFGDVGGLPDVRGFLAEYAGRLRPILKQRWEQLSPPSSPEPLVVNILINPNLLFCHRDAMRGQYSRYFRPVYLDPNAVKIDAGEQNDDDIAKAIVELHRTFDKHYDEDLETRPFLSLNDTEALLLTKEITNPLPPADKVISIWSPSDNSKPFEILSDVGDYRPQIKEALRQSGAPNVEEKFNRYLIEVTKHKGSYHHVTIGSSANWVGRIYIAFRDGDARSRCPEWITAAKSFAFDVVAPLALAGTFIRNPGVIAMLGDVRDLLLHSHETRRRHSTTFDRFFGSPAQANRRLFPTIDYINTMELFRVLDDTSHRLRQTREHFRKSTPPCWCTLNAHEKLTHALKHCKEISSAGSAFLVDLFDILKSIRAFEGLADDTIEYLADVLAFGLTEDSKRPSSLNDKLEQRNITEKWITTCQRDERIEKLVPKSVRPFLRALLVMVGNQTMVSTDANSFGIRLEDATPVLKVLNSYDRHFLATVHYKASGELNQDGAREMEPRDRDGLQTNNNNLLVHFGKHFLDDFRMCVTTAVKGKVLKSRHRWIDDMQPSEGTISYEFRFSR